MKLTPLESSIERVAVRILSRHKKELEAYITLAYQRAVGQAVEFLEAKTSPATKANKTRKEMKRTRECLESLRRTFSAWRADGRVLALSDLDAILNAIAVALDVDAQSNGG